MYQDFFKLRDFPFSLAPDPKYLFRTESLLEVFANLQYGVESGKGIVVITGEVGCGKTTILRSMLQLLDGSVLAAYIFNPLLATQEFFDLLASEFRIPPQASKASMLRMLGQLLMARHTRGLRTVLVVDEAHLLPRHLLEEIRLLSNFETNRDKLLQIVLCGQPELHDLLGQPDLRQLKQRVNLKSTIKRLSAAETAEYIRWRLRIAGARDEGLFEGPAIEAVYRFSNGIPRIVNNICDNALLTGYSQGIPRVTMAIVAAVVEELDLAAPEETGAPIVVETIPGPGNHERQNSDRRHSAPNVSHIRRDPIAPSLFTAAVASPAPAAAANSAASAGTVAAAWEQPASFVLQSAAGPAAEEPLKFFSRVRVTRRA